MAATCLPTFDPFRVTAIEVAGLCTLWNSYLAFDGRLDELGPTCASLPLLALSIPFHAGFPQINCRWKPNAPPPAHPLSRSSSASSSPKGSGSSNHFPGVKHVVVGSGSNGSGAAPSGAVGAGSGVAMPVPGVDGNVRRIREDGSPVPWFGLAGVPEHGRGVAPATTSVVPKGSPPRDPRAKAVGKQEAVAPASEPTGKASGADRSCNGANGGKGKGSASTERRGVGVIGQGGLGNGPASGAGASPNSGSHGYSGRAEERAGPDVAGKKSDSSSVKLDGIGGRKGSGGRDGTHGSNGGQAGAGSSRKRDDLLAVLAAEVSMPVPVVMPPPVGTPIASPTRPASAASPPAVPASRQGPDRSHSPLRGDDGRGGTHAVARPPEDVQPRQNADQSGAALGVEHPKRKGVVSPEVSRVKTKPNRGPDLAGASNAGGASGSGRHPRGGTVAAAPSPRGGVDVSGTPVVSSKTRPPQPSQKAARESSHSAAPEGERRAEAATVVTNEPPWRGPDYVITICLTLYKVSGGCQAELE